MGQTLLKNHVIPWGNQLALRSYNDSATIAAIAIDSSQPRPIAVSVLPNGMVQTAAVSVVRPAWRREKRCEGSKRWPVWFVQNRRETCKIMKQTDPFEPVCACKLKLTIYIYTCIYIYIYVYVYIYIYIYTYIYIYALYIFTLYIYTWYIYTHYIYTLYIYTLYIYIIYIHYIYIIYIHYIYTLCIFTLYIYIIYIDYIYIIYIYILIIYTLYTYTLYIYIIYIYIIDNNNNNNNNYHYNNNNNNNNNNIYVIFDLLKVIALNHCFMLSDQLGIFLESWMAWIAFAVCITGYMMEPPCDLRVVPRSTDFHLLVRECCPLPLT